MNPLFLFGKPMTPIRKLLMMKAVAGGIPISEYTATGNPLSFNTNIVKPLKSLVLPWTPTQSGTGDQSPSNVRPISGVSALNVWQTGKNLLNVNRTEASPNPTTTSNETSPRIMDTTHYFVGIRSDNYYYKNYVSVASVSNGVVSVQSSNANDYGVGFPVCVKGGQKYTLSYTAENKMVSFGFYDEDWNYLSQNNSSLSTVPRTVTVPSGASYMVIVFRSNIGITYTYSNIMLEVGESASEYSPYTGQSYPVVFPALGKNLFNKDDEAVTTGVWWKGRVQTGGAYDSFKASNLIPVVPGETYRLTRTTTGQSACCYFDSSKTYVSQENWDNYTPSRTIPEGVYYFAFTVNADAIDSAMFEKGSTQSPYEPYTNTVYGGTLDLVSGELWAGNRFALLNNANAWEISDNPNYTFIYNTDTVVERKIYDNSYTGLQCSICPIDNDKRFYGRWNGATGVKFCIRDRDSIITLSELQTLATNGDISICYDIEPVLVATLTPTQITALLGDNTIWSDTNGSNTAIYLKKG